MIINLLPRTITIDNPSAMKNLIVYYDDDKTLTTKLEDVPIPSDLKPHEVLIKVSVAGSNPKDWSVFLHINPF